MTSLRLPLFRGGEVCGVWVGGGLFAFEAVFHADEEHEHGGDEEDGEDGGHGEAAEDDAAQALVEFGAGAGVDNEGEHAEDAGGGGHVDGAKAGAGRFDDGFTVFHVADTDVIERLMDDKDRVVHHDADENDEPEHGEDIHVLLGDEDVYEAQSDEPACACERHGEHDDDGVEEVSEERGH